MRAVLLGPSSNALSQERVRSRSSEQRSPTPVAQTHHCAMQDTTRSTQQTTDNMHQTTCSTQQTTDNMQQTTCSTQQTTDNMQQTTCSTQQTTDNLQPTACSTQQTTDNLQPTACSGARLHHAAAARVAHRGGPCHIRAPKCRICTGARLARLTSAPGLRPPRPHLHPDWARPLTATSAPGLGSAPKCRICACDLPALARGLG